MSVIMYFFTILSVLRIKNKPLKVSEMEIFYDIDVL